MLEQRFGDASAPPHLTNPFAVVRAAHLTTDEKRQLLSFWLSDIHAVPDHPALRRLEDGTVLHVDALRTALRALDDSSRLGRRLRTRAFVDDRRLGNHDPANPGGRPPRGRRSALPPPPEFVDARAGRTLQHLSA
jgi:hypothetical protein